MSPSWNGMYVYQSSQLNKCMIPYFFDQTPQLLFYSLFILVQLLIEGGVYFVGRLLDGNDGWIRYMRAIQLGLIDAGSTCIMHSLSVLLSAMKTSLRTRTGLEIAHWASVAIISTWVRVLCILATATIRGQCLFCLELLIVWLLFEGSNCLRAASNRRKIMHDTKQLWLRFTRRHIHAYT